MMLVKVPRDCIDIALGTVVDRCERMHVQVIRRSASDTSPPNRPAIRSRFREVERPAAKSAAITLSRSRPPVRHAPTECFKPPRGCDEGWARD